MEYILIQKILKKIENHEDLTREEKVFVDRIGHEKPDCLAYSSETRKDGTCFCFLNQDLKTFSS